MRNEQLDLAKTFLKQEGYDDIPDQVLVQLFALIRDEPSAVYEPGDFVVFNAGMGNSGFGWVQGRGPDGYIVKLWMPDDFQNIINLGVGEGDVKSLSSTQEAKDYHRICSR